MNDYELNDNHFAIYEYVFAFRSCVSLYIEEVSLATCKEDIDKKLKFFL